MNYLKITNPGQTWVADIECDGLSPSVIWCLCLLNYETREESVFTDKESFLVWRKENPLAVFIGHNFLSFDGPVLNRLWDADIDLENQVIDTLVLSYLYDPALDGGHSLGSWGERLKFSKFDFSDWSCLSPTMILYCRNDCQLTLRVYLALTKKMNRLGFSETSAWIEHQIRIVIDEQTTNGWYFHKDRALEFRQFLRDRQKEIERSISHLFPPVRELLAERTIYKKDGCSPTSVYLKDKDRYIIEEDWNLGTYRAYVLEPFNLGSPKQRVQRLLELGWKPEKHTKKGFPQVDEEALVRLSLALSEQSRTEEGKAVEVLAEWLVLQGRASMLDTWLNNLGPDSRMHGKIITCGATTRRMTHHSPNCVPLYSQALTRNGWKFYNELVIGEDILAYDISTKTKKWTPLLAVSSFPEAEIYSFGQQHEGKRLYCTKNHSWVVRDRDCKGYKDTEKLVEAQYLKYNRPVKINAPFDNDVKGSKFSLIQEKYGKDWTSEICKMSDPELHSIMQGFLLADGCRPKGHNTWQFAQSEGPLLDAFLTAFYLISDTRISAAQKRKLKGKNQRMGYNVVQTTNTFMRTKDMSLRFEGIEPVWCPTTEFGTWVMKQGDFITITGNTANIPSGAKAKYGKECRSFWGVQPFSDLCLVGYDASGLETAGLCHYLNNPNAVDVLLRPKPDDIHTANAKRLTEALGWAVDREWGAKTSWYAWLYGAYPKKLGSIVGALKNGMSEEDAGDVVIETFFRNVPGLKNLIESVRGEWRSRSGRLVTIDGGFVVCSSEGAALNYRIQSAGAIVMKLAGILLRKEGRRLGLRFRKVGDIHDEGQLECRKDDADTLGRLAVSCITMAGRDLGFGVTLSGDYKIGDSWEMTH